MSRSIEEILQIDESKYRQIYSLHTIALQVISLLLLVSIAVLGLWWIPLSIGGALAAASGMGMSESFEIVHFIIFLIFALGAYCLLILPAVIFFETMHTITLIGRKRHLKSNRSHA